MFELIAYHSEKGRRNSTLASNILGHIKPNHRYIVLLSNSLELAMILLEIYKHNAVAIPLSPQISKSHLDHIKSHSNAHGMFIQKVGCVKFEKLDKEELAASDQRFIIYTSGSTGNPKGVVHNKESVEANAKSVAMHHNFSSNSPHATCLPLFHCNALMMSLLGCYLFDTPLIILEDFCAETYFKAIKHHKVVTASIVPALLHKLLESPPEWPTTLKYLITAAAPLSKALAKKFYDQYQNKLVQGYGLSEAVNFSFIMPALSKREFIKEYIWNHPPVGLPVEGTKFRLNSDQEVEVSGANNMIGYLNNPEANQEVFTQDGWLKTGDLGYMRNNYLVLSGRKKEIINRGGESLHPNELDEVFSELIVDSNYFIVPVHDDELDSEIGLIIDVMDTTPNLKSMDYYLEQIYRESSIIPVNISYQPALRTSTRKPQRLKMGQSLISQPVSWWELLKIFWSESQSNTLSSDEQKDLTQCLRAIIPNKHVIKLKSLKLTNQNHSFTQLMRKLANTGIESSINRNQLNNNEESLFNYDIDAIEPNSTFSCLVIPPSIRDHLSNPFYRLAKTYGHKSPLAQLAELPGEQLKNFNRVQCLPIHYKQYIFATLIIMDNL